MFLIFNLPFAVVAKRLRLLISSLIIRTLKRYRNESEQQTAVLYLM